MVVKKGRVILLMLVFFFPSLLEAQSQTQSDEKFRKGEVIVEIRPGASIDDVNGRYQTATIQRVYGTNFYRLALPAGKKEKKIRKKLARHPDVLSVGLNPIVSSPFTSFARSIMEFPDSHPTTGQSRESYLSQQLVDNLAAVKVRSTGKGVLVAVIDTGVDFTHPELGGRMWTTSSDSAGNLIDDDNDGLIDDYQGWDFIDNDNDPAEALSGGADSIAGHGTFIAGLIKFLAQDARVMAVRAFAPDGTSDAFTVASAIKYAADHGAQVINLSFGSPEDSTLLRDAIKYARQRGAVVIAALGNENSDTDDRPQYPAGYRDDAMGVVAIDSAGRRASFSNFGGAASVSAPGVRLISTFPGAEGEFATWSGTSFATPLAAAEAALILESAPNNSNVRRTIEDTAISIDNLNPGLAGKLGRGRIDPLRALQSIEPASGVRAEIDLVPTGVEPSARGSAEVSFDANKQELEIEGRGLRVRTQYKLVIDGNIITGAQLITTNFGELEVEFSKAGEEGHLPLPPSLDPVNRIKHVEVRDDSDRVVLQGDFGSAAGGGPSGQVFEKEARLEPTGPLPGAEGRARVKVETQREELRVEAEGLMSGLSYQIVVDGLTIASAVAQSGYLKLEFTTDGSSGLVLPPALRPAINITRVQVRDIALQIVLQGDFQTTGDDVGGGDDDGGGQFDFRGTIESLPAFGLIGEWRVGGRIVRVSASTRINQERAAAVIGALVEVKGSLQPDGSVDATEVEVKAGPGGGGGGGEVRKEAALIPTGVDPDASGRVKVRVSGAREDLDIEAERLNPNASYTIVIDGASVGAFTTDGIGSLRIEWSTEPGKPPPPVRPVTAIRRVEIRDSGGGTVLVGILPE